MNHNMPRLIGTLLSWTVILCACSAFPASPRPIPPAPSETPLPAPTTAVPPDTQNCGYQWAYQDLPELSSSFQQSIQTLQPEAQAYAFAFGENCILNDGTVARFIPMETDFNITIPVGDAATEEDMGEWIVKIMQVIEAIPAEQIVGPRGIGHAVRVPSDAAGRGASSP